MGLEGHSPGTIPSSVVCKAVVTLWDNTSHNVQIAAKPYTQIIPDLSLDVITKVWYVLSVGPSSNLDIVTGVVPQGGALVPRHSSDTRCRYGAVSTR